MAVNNKSKTKNARGRPATGVDPSVTIRLPQDLIDKIDAWSRHVETTRSGAIRRLVEQALAAQPKSRKAR